MACCACRESKSESKRRSATPGGGAKALLQFIVRRLLISLVVLVLITLMVFASQRLLPGDPVRVWAGEEQDPASLAFFRHKYGLDQPILMQYLTWLALAVQGDF